MLGSAAYTWTFLKYFGCLLIIVNTVSWSILMEYTYWWKIQFKDHYVIPHNLLASLFTIAWDISSSIHWFLGIGLLWANFIWLPLGVDCTTSWPRVLKSTKRKLYPAPGINSLTVKWRIRPKFIILLRIVSIKNWNTILYSLPINGRMVISLFLLIDVSPLIMVPKT